MKELFPPAVTGRVVRAFSALAFVLLLSTASAIAQDTPQEEVPAPIFQEMMIKSALMTFNDANITGNYTVLQESLAKPFRDQYSADKLKEVFKPFADNHIFINAIVVAKPVLTEPARIDERGALLLHGYFDVSEVSRVTFALDYLISEGVWKVINIQVKVGKPGAN
ncbi:MAG TPA: hypothetical protein VFB16_10820 [Bauldia sp.]|nr:hypothetical protein [Bauldia sp.]